MADIITTGTSGYATGSIDTASTVVNNVTATDAVQPNGLAAAIIGVETILGTGTTLKGSLADLVTRLAVCMDANGVLKLSTDAAVIGPLSAAKGGTGYSTVSLGKRLVGNATSALQLLDPFRRDVYTADATWTCPAGVTQVFVEVYGAGGGGGGQGGTADAGAGDVGAYGLPGQSGGYASGYMTVTPASGYAVVCGAGGTAGSGGSNGIAGTSGTAGSDGGAGGASSFNSTTITANGGAKGYGGYGGQFPTGTPQQQFIPYPGTGTAGTVLVHGGGRAGGNGQYDSRGVSPSAGQSGLVVIWY